MPWLARIALGRTPTSSPEHASNYLVTLLDGQHAISLGLDSTSLPSQPRTLGRGRTCQPERDLFLRRSWRSVSWSIFGCRIEPLHSGFRAESASVIDCVGIFATRRTFEAWQMKWKLDVAFNYCFFLHVMLAYKCTWFLNIRISFCGDIYFKKSRISRNWSISSTKANPSSFERIRIIRNRLLSKFVHIFFLYTKGHFEHFFIYENIFLCFTLFISFFLYLEFLCSFICFFL